VASTVEPASESSGRAGVTATPIERITLRLGLVAAVAAAASLMLVSLGKRPFWADETVSVEAAKLPLRLLGHYLFRVELNMALYHVVLHGWLRLGSGEEFARLLSVIFGLATLPVVYVLARRLFDARTATISVVLLSVNVACVGHAREARSYSLALFLVTASTLFLVRAVEDGQDGDWVLYATTTALAVYAHLFDALVVPAQVLSLLGLGRAAPWRRLSISLAGSCLLLLPALAAVVVHRQGGQIDWLTAPAARQLPGLILWFTDSRLLVMFFFAAAALALLRAYQDWRAGGRSAQVWRYVLLVAWLVVPAALAFAISFEKPVYLYRYFLPSLPALIVLVAAGIAQVRRAWLVVPAVVVAAAISTRTVAQCLPDCKVRYDDWRSAAAYVAPRVKAGDAVLFDPRDVKPPFAFYLPRSARPALLYPTRWSLIGGPAPGARTLSAAVSQADHHRRVWLVTWWLPQGAVPGELAHSFRVVADRTFAGSVRVRLYVRS
jgi:mannosyltransferase